MAYWQRIHVIIEGQIDGWAPLAKCWGL